MEVHFQHCADHLRQNDYGRYISCLFLEPQLREATFALYAFHAKIREIPALISDPMPGEIRIQWWMDIINNTSILSGDPMARSLQEIIVKYEMPIERIEYLLKAHIFDLYNDPITDRQALEAYLGETSSCLYLLLVHVANKIANQHLNSDQSTLIADACGHGGVFVGVVELLKALPFHQHHQQSYFPEELSPYPKVEKHLEQVKISAINELWLADIYQYSINHYQAAMQAVARLPQHARMLFGSMDLSRLELEGIHKRGIDLNKAMVPPSHLAIIWHLWKAKRKLAKITTSP